MPAAGGSESAFKLWINADVLKRMGASLRAVYPKFDAKGFARLAPKLDPLELKDRVRFVRCALHEFLPGAYPENLGILLESAKCGKLKGFDLWPYSDYIQTYGLEHFEISMRALRQLTPLFSSEFAVRPFLRKYEGQTLRLLKKWAADPDVHVRRWVSEGTRPRLPWGERLPAFVQDPNRTLPLLEVLRNDPELYVRKSVANHLNDITKDHPEIVIETLARWIAKARPAELKNLHWIRNHALRSLIKAGHPGALALVGVRTDAQIVVSGFELKRKRCRVEEHLEFSFELCSEADSEQQLIVDYVIHHVRSNGGRSPKVFKLCKARVGAGERLRIAKRHWLRVVTTRRYYPGEHLLEIQVNGKVLASVPWVLAGV